MLHARELDPTPPVPAALPAPDALQPTTAQHLARLLEHAAANHYLEATVAQVVALQHQFLVTEHERLRRDNLRLAVELVDKADKLNVSPDSVIRQVLAPTSAVPETPARREPSTPMALPRRERGHKRSQSHTLVFKVQLPHTTPLQFHHWAPDGSELVSNTPALPVRTHKRHRLEQIRRPVLGLPYVPLYAPPRGGAAMVAMPPAAAVPPPVQRPPAGFVFPRREFSLGPQGTPAGPLPGHGRPMLPAMAMLGTPGPAVLPPMLPMPPPHTPVQREASPERRVRRGDVAFLMSTPEERPQ